MNCVMKKMFNRIISVFLVGILAVNSVLATRPVIDVDALVNSFQTESFARAMLSGGGKVVVPLRYYQKGGTYGGENRDVYVWNLIGAVDTDSSGLFGLIMQCIEKSKKMRESGVADRLIVEGLKVAGEGFSVLRSKKFTDAAAKTYKENANSFVDNAAKCLGLESDQLKKCFKEAKEIFKVEDTSAFGNMLKESFGKVYANNTIMSLLGSAVSVIGIGMILEGSAKLVEDARNIGDTRSIMDGFLELVKQGKYKDKNLLVVAKDNRELHAYHAFTGFSSEPVFIDFARSNVEGDFGRVAPLFKSEWISKWINEGILPAEEWAKIFMAGLSETSKKITEALQDPILNHPGNPFAALFA